MPPMSGVDAVAMSPGRERDDGVHSGTVGGFPASVLLSDDFDAQEFVARARRGTPLDDLLQDLQRHLLQLRESLVDTINHDYATFVGMASNLKGLDAALMRVRLPVNSLREEVGELRNAAAEAVRTMDHRLDERHAVTSQRRRLCLLLDAEQGLQRMEALLARERSPSLEAITDAGGEDPTLAKQAAAADLARTVEVLERVANEGARLKALVRRLNDESSSSAKNDLAQRLQRLEDGLVAQTCGTLGLLLAYPGGAAGRADQGARIRCGTLGLLLAYPGGAAARADQGDGAPLAGIERVVEACLRTLVVAERSDACQTVLRQECMRPFVAAAVSVEALEAGVTGSCQGLAAVYARILTFVDRFCLPLAALAASAFPPPSSGVSQGSAPSPLARRSFVLGACLLAELSPVLLSVGGRRVTHYLDKALAGKYKATMALLAALEERCGCRTEAQAFRAHVAVEDLLQKWELPLRAHLQLRQQEATKALQPLLVGPAALSAEMQDNDMKTG
ncbi:oligomeric golgi complex component, COG2-domain-containing protein [Baffinella frigidus]|nr:oligomeric golgi complex component, COG2-domain-containing protein [Cryptophyta sp. CCMP2293]